MQTVGVHRTAGTCNRQKARFMVMCAHDGRRKMQCMKRKKTVNKLGDFLRVPEKRKNEQKIESTRSLGPSANRTAISRFHFAGLNSRTAAAEFFFFSCGANTVCVALVCVERAASRPRKQNTIIVYSLRALI